MISMAEGGAGFLLTITKPAAWRGSLQVLEDFEGHVRPMRRRQEKRKERAKHWPCDSEAQGVIVLVGMRLMGALEVQSVPPGKRCSK